MARIISSFGLSLFFLTMLGFGGCSDLSPTGGPRPLVKQDLETAVSEKFRPLRLHEIAVYPLVVDPAARGELSPEDLERLSGRLSDTVTLNTSFAVSVGGNKGGDALEASRLVHGPLSAKAARYGENLGAQAVLYGVVSRYRKSDGGRLGADNAASVRFRLWLIDVSSAEILWEASFDRSDKPLSENIFEIPSKVTSGVRYEDALDLATDGFLDAAKDLEKRRSEARAS